MLQDEDVCFRLLLRPWPNPHNTPPLSIIIFSNPAGPCIRYLVSRRKTFLPSRRSGRLHPSPVASSYGVACLVPGKERVCVVPSSPFSRVFCRHIIELCLADRDRFPHFFPLPPLLKDLTAAEGLYIKSWLPTCATLFFVLISTRNE